MDFVLVTYVPFYRFHEVVVWQLLNAKRLGVGYVVAYVDNVYTEEQVGLLYMIVDRYSENSKVKVVVVPGNWRSRCGTWFSIIRAHLRAGKPFVVIDSDNEVVDPDKVLRFIDWVVREHGPMAGVLDTTALVGGRGIPLQFAARTVSVVEEDGMKIGFYETYRPGLRNNPFFFGPKQIVILNIASGGVYDKEKVGRTLDRIERAFTAVNPVLRNYISDETLLGLFAHLLGVGVIAYLVGGTVHHTHNSTPGVTQRHYKHLVARAHYEFAKALCREGLCNRWYLLRYFLSNLYNALGWLV